MTILILISTFVRLTNKLTFLKIQTMKKIAAIDIGSNSFHLIIVQILQNGNLEIIHREREVLRLSENFTIESKIISAELIEKSILVLNRFSEIAKNHKAEIFAVATSSVRESSNQNIFLNKIFDETGIQIKVIDGIEEARLIYLGVSNSVKIKNKKCFCIDIGGGSTEFIVGINDEIIFSESLKLGAVRLTKKFFPDLIISESNINECKKYIEQNLSELKSKSILANLDLVIGTSGTILSVGNLINSIKFKKDNFESLNNFKIRKDDLLEIQKIILSKKTLEERKIIVGLDEKRADIIPAGIILLSSIFEQFQIEEMVISEFALREGIIFDSLKRKT
ncbi:MAG: Ppx/GppA family phosphatase [Ignavibacteriae bacterium]|nr:Ppx/GppA family phosphatase [Ignavibacteriota bacterium]